MNRNQEQFEGALGERLRGAYASLNPDDVLAGSIRAEMAAETAAEPPKPRVFRLRWRLATLAAAAVVAITTVGLFVYPGRPHAHGGAVAELRQIHKDNLAGGSGFLHTNDPKQAEAYFKRELGFVPKVLCSEDSLKLTGFRTVKFRGQIVANYTVASDAGEVSIVVADGNPKALGLKCNCGHHGCSCVHKGQCDECTIAGVEIDGRSYCAIGNVSKEVLGNVLASLTPPK